MSVCVCVCVCVLFLRLSDAAGVRVGVCPSCEVECYSQGMCVRGARVCPWYCDVEWCLEVCLCGVCHFKAERCPNARVCAQYVTVKLNGTEVCH